MNIRTFVGRIIVITMIAISGAHANSFSETDRQLTQQVELLISKQPDLGNQLTVRARNGVVYIGGTPWTQFDVPNLETKVRQIPGVAGVVVTAVYPEN